VSARLPERPGEAIRRDTAIRIRFEGRTVGAFAGDTVGSALAAAGVTIVGRSFKYHRARGLMCMTGSCPNCLMQIDGVPNVRACTEPVADGMRVERQNAWPNVDRDVHGLLDAVSFMMPPGFYYKIFQRPRWAWRAVEPYIRSQAGLGKVPREGSVAHGERVNLHCDVLVIGGGPAGLAAAAESARAGADTVLLEERRDTGGHLQFSADPTTREELRGDATSAGARILCRTPAFGVFDGPLVAAADAERLYRIRAANLIFATGAIEQPAVFPNNDLPGVMLSSAVELLVNRYGVLPGRRAVVLTANDAGHATARTLRDAGADVTIADLRSESPHDDGIRVLPGVAIAAAAGRRHVASVVVRGREPGSDETLPCDLVVVAGFSTPSANLVSMTGAGVKFDDRLQAFLPIRLPSNVHAVGGVAGAASLDAAIAQGRLAGIEVAAASGYEAKDVAGRIDEMHRRAAEQRYATALPPAVGFGRGKQLACVCMDVTDKELETAVAEGFDSMELLKRYTTITMGPCQGKSCMLSSQRLCGRATGRALEETPPTTARPPWTPVELGTLAGSRLTPRKETAMHDRNVEAGASFMWAADWRRPHHYTSVADEVRAVRRGVGLIDVSSLGKFLVRGPGAVSLLEHLYPNRFGDLAVGRVRYGVMLNDQGVIIDDGTVCRLGDEEFFITVTTGNTAAIERWISWWLADAAFDAHVLNATSAYASVNLAGPDARKVMERLTDRDVSAAAVPYLSASTMTVCDVPSILLRIGFVGELGYEIHLPSMYGEHAWDSILAAGKDFDIRPFGLEAQRILRLEKHHILVGQDTDAESDPFETGLAWTIKDDKPDFLGKRALEDLRRSGPSERLVGFTSRGGWLPPEGAAVVHDGVWVGRITSARRSDAAGCIVGLAWVPAGWAQDGTTFDVRSGDRLLRAVVALQAPYDPEGTRLRS
jgi:sarcosine oxidase, subunit alpha